MYNMKKNKKTLINVILTISFFMIGGGCFFAWIIVGMMKGVNFNVVEYYKDNNNYEEVVCIVREAENYGGEKYKFFEPLESEKPIRNVGLWKRNDGAVADSGFWEDTNIGDRVTTISAPGYFWDGYICPIVGLRTENQVYLDFNTGKENQIAELQNMRNEYLSVATPMIGIALTSIGIAIVFGVISLINGSKRTRAN
ncbi:hypothetical protein FACS1894211_05670 [Clostridia bacterium]|nr:hypothetical protein FACS1894211_05670 [Clostridia bacterium]